MKLFLVVLMFSFNLGAAETYNCSYTSQTDFNATTVSVQARPKNSARRCLLLKNTSAGILNAWPAYIKFGSAHTTASGYTLLIGQEHEFVNVPIGAIYMMSGSSTQTVTIYEGQ